ncbi:trans-sialidase, partial [Trypanosoma rangeli]
VHDVGPVSNEEHDAAASSLLYRKKREKEEELILLYEKKAKNGEGDLYSLVAVNLKDKLPQIKEVVQHWTALDKALTNCASTGTVDPRIKNVCRGPIPTKGLVGLLSSTWDGTAWKDEYLGVNATVKTGELASDEWGVTFKGAGAGAEWPVGSKGQNQPYYFANNKFTLVATVMINAVPEKASSPIPLMGVRMNDANSTVLVGLSYTRDGKWEVTVNGDPQELSDDGYTWEPTKMYQVAMNMNWDEFSVFVDGANIYDSDDDEDEEGTVSKNVEALFKSHRISHFYFGGDSAAEGTATSHDVTVSNVLLYNDALFSSEIGKLKASKVELPQPAAEKQTEREDDSSVTTGGLNEKNNAADNLLDEERSPADSGAGNASPSAQGPVASPPSPSTSDFSAEEGDQTNDVGTKLSGQEDATQTPPQPSSEGASEAHHGGDAAGGSDEGRTSNEAEEEGEMKEEEEDGNDVSGLPLAPSSSSPDMKSAATPGEDAPAAVAPENASGKQMLGPGAEHVAPEAAVGSGGSSAAINDAGNNAPVPAGPLQPPPPSSGEKEGEAAEQQTSDNAAGAALPGAGAAATGAANASGKQMLGPGAEAAAPEAAVGPGGSSAANSDAGQAPAKDTSDISPPGAVEVSNGDNKEASQGADNAPANKTALPEPQAIPPTRNAAPLSGNVSATFKNITGVRLDEGGGDGAEYGGYVRRLLLLVLLGLWGIAALSAA